MEFKEAMKIRERMCNYHKECKDCPLNKLESGCLDALEEAEEIDEYEKILEEWAKEHQVVTNADKFIELLKNAFGKGVDGERLKIKCLNYILGTKCNDDCKSCLKWWGKEYKEPKREKEQ